MWKQLKKFIIKVNTNKLWSSIWDVINWSKWDPDIKKMILNNPLVVGGKFTLETFDGQIVELEITKLNSHIEFEDVTQLPNVKMYTSHFFKEVNKDATEIMVKIRLKGSDEDKWTWLAQSQINSLDK